MNYDKKRRLKRENNQSKAYIKSLLSKAQNGDQEALRLTQLFAPHLNLGVKDDKADN